MKRAILLTFILYLALSVCSCTAGRKDVNFSIVSNSDVTLYNNSIEDDIRLLVISDTHLWQSDDRERPYQKYSKRMSGAYNVTKHYETGKETTPLKSLREATNYAVKHKMDAIICIGDMVSYPSEYGIELLKRILDSTGINWYYTAGNHDWHYEGMPGSQYDQRKKWIKERLHPLYPSGSDPLSYSVEIKGLKLLLIDDSICEISPEQLRFFRQENKDDKPMILFSHIPLYAPGAGVGYSIGHPDWNLSTDRNYIVEKREPWPEKGHTETTFSFREEILKSPNIIATFSGHVHTYSIYSQNGVPCFTVGANCRGGYYDVKIVRTNPHT